MVHVVCGSGPVAALAGVRVDEARLAVVQEGVSQEALVVSVHISWVRIQAIRAAIAEVDSGILGGRGSWGGAGLWGEACRITHGKML